MDLLMNNIFLKYFVSEWVCFTADGQEKLMDIELLISSKTEIWFIYVCKIRWGGLIIMIWNISWF